MTARWAALLLAVSSAAGVSAAAKLGTKKHPLLAYVNPAVPENNLDGATFTPVYWGRLKKHANRVHWQQVEGRITQMYVAPAETRAYRWVSTPGEVYLPRGSYVLAATFAPSPQQDPPHFDYGPVPVQFKGHGKQVWLKLLPVGVTSP